MVNIRMRTPQEVSKNPRYTTEQKKRIIKEMVAEQIKLQDKRKHQAEKYLPDCNKVLCYMAVLQYALMGLQDSLTDEGKFKQGVKHNVNECTRICNQMYMTYWNGFSESDSKLGRWLNHCMDTCNTAIEESVLLQGSERYSAICMALYRLIKKHSDVILNNCGKWLLGKYIPVMIHTMESRLLPLIQAQDKHIDVIIEKCIPFDDILCEGELILEGKNE